MSEPQSSVFSICIVSEISARSDIRNQAGETCAAGATFVDTKHLQVGRLCRHKATLITQQIFGALNTLRTGDADLCFYVTTVQDG